MTCKPKHRQRHLSEQARRSRSLPSVELCQEATRGASLPIGSVEPIQVMAMKIMTVQGQCVILLGDAFAFSLPFLIFSPCHLWAPVAREIFFWVTSLTGLIVTPQGKIWFEKCHYNYDQNSNVEADKFGRSKYRNYLEDRLQSLIM